MRFDFGVRLAGMAILTAAIGGLSVTPAAAQRRGPSAAQIKAMQQKVQQQQENAYGVQLVLDKRQKEVLAKYDLNGDGKLDLKEKPPYDKYWREVRSGKQPNPLDPSTVSDAEIQGMLKSVPGTQANQQSNKPPAKKPATK